MADETHVDTITLDIIESALKNARFEMDAVLYRTAMSPSVREQHDEFPMITDPEGRMVVGQFGSYIPELLKDFGPVYEGDVILMSDPYECAGSVSHLNDWMVIYPIFYAGERVGFSSLFGHMMDVGGPVPGSQPQHATTILGEGLRIPPLKLFERGQLNEPLLKLILHNVRTPEMNRSDLMGIVAGCRVAAKRVQELCDRFGKETYLAACQELLDRTRRAMAKLIKRYIKEEKKTFIDWVDEDGLGNGPFKMQLTVWREGEKAFFDFTGTDKQAPGPINFHINEGLMKMFCGVYLIMNTDPQILFNDGFYDLFEVVLPKGTIMNPEFPAAVGNRLNTHTRMFDVLSGALGLHDRQLGMAAGYGTSPYFVYSGRDKNGNYFQLVELLFGGIPGRPHDDGLDGHSWWPLFTANATEFLESYYPVRIDQYSPRRDTGGPGLNRGGAGILKKYTFLEPGEVSINDDRHITHPWGIWGGRYGGRSYKKLIRKDGTEVELPAQKDLIRVEPGDQLLFCTAGAGGWGDPLERPAERVWRDAIRGLISVDQARSGYGVVIEPETMRLDDAATERLRAELRAAPECTADFDFGPRPAVIPPEQWQG